MSQYSPMKLVIKIPKKKMGTAFAVPTIKIDGENTFKEALYLRISLQDYISQTDGRQPNGRAQPLSAQA